MIDPLCSECGNELTREEERHYGYRCEQCELAWNSRVHAWRNGAEDEELDRLHGDLHLTVTKH